MAPLPTYQKGRKLSSGTYHGSAAVSGVVNHHLTAVVQYTHGHNPGEYTHATTPHAVGNDAPTSQEKAPQRTFDENTPTRDSTARPTPPTTPTPTYSIISDTRQSPQRGLTNKSNLTTHHGAPYRKCW